MATIPSNDLSIYFRTQFDCNQVYQKITENVDYLYNKLLSHQYFPVSFDHELQQYPIFPHQYNGIFNLYKIDPNTNTYIYQFNLVKIQNFSLYDLKSLKDNINQDLLQLKNQLDKYSTNPEKLVFDIRFQRLYYDFDYIDSKKVLLNQKHIEDYNYFYNVLGFYDTSLDCNIIENILLMIVTNLIFFYKNTFYIDFSSQFLLNSTADLNTDFLNFVDDCENEISEYLTKFIVNYIFEMLKPSPEILDLIQLFIKDNVLPKFKSCFTNFAAGYQNGKKIINSIILTYLRNYISYFIYLDLTTNNVSFINDYNNNRINTNYIFQDEIQFEEYVNKIQKHNIQKYLNLSYLYKSFPLTYLNILSYIMKEFIDNTILPESELNLLVQQNFINSDIEQIINNNLINFNLSNYLADYSDSNKLLSLYNDNKIGELCIFYFTKKIIKDFIESDFFNNFVINDFLESTFIYLRDNILIDQNMNWYHDINLTKWIFELFMDKYSSNIFPTFKTDIDNTMNELFEDKPQIIGEVLNQIAGNNYYKAQYKIDINKDHKVFINGSLINQSQYTIDKDVVIFNFSLSLTDVVTLDYYLYYVDFDYDQTSINHFLNGFKKNKIIQEYTSQLLKNIFRGSVTKSIFNKILKYFMVA